MRHVPRPDVHSATRGFALLEVLVAFVIAAVALGGLLAAALEGLGATATAGAYEEAVARARSHLAAIGRSGPLLAGTQQGDDGGGFAWQSRIALLASAPSADASAGPPVGLYAVSVIIGWRAGRHERAVTLQTERVAPAPAPTP